MFSVRVIPLRVISIRLISIRLISLLCLLSLYSSCLKIRISPLLEEGSPTFHRDEASPIQFMIQGKEVWETDWPKALSISRFFFTGIENESGSLGDLLLPALAEATRKKGYFSLSEELLVPFCLDVNLKRHHLLWLPPREFIQTFSARKMGEVRLDFLISIALYIDRKCSQARIQEKPLLWTDTFQEKRTLHSYPGNQKSVLELVADQTLSSFFTKLTLALPQASTMMRKANTSKKPTPTSKY